MKISSPSFLNRILLIATLFSLGVFNNSYAQKISAGGGHTLLICSDGTVKAWGDNGYDQIGIDNNLPNSYNSNVPIVVPGLTGTITAVSAGGSHSLALKSDGTVWSWGNNNDGELGDGTGNQSFTPVQVLGLSGVIAISAGYYHSMALKSDGTVWTWGSNSSGQLGDSTTNSSLVPVQARYLANIIAISAGNNHSMALKSDSTVWTWGANYSGQLGLGTTDDSIYACKVPGLSKIIAIDGGGDFSMALKNTGTIISWGDNGYGQLGDGTQNQSSVPVPVISLSNVKAISAGASHSMALKNDSTVWKWGQNLPVPSRTMKTNTSPAVQNTVAAQIPGLSGIFAVSAGSVYELAFKSNETVWSWGSNYQGQLGNGNYSDETDPVQAHCVCGNLFPTVSASADVTICPGASTTIIGSVSGGNGGPFSYEWSPANNLTCTTCSNPIANPFTPTTYYVNGFDWKMCSALDSVMIDTFSHPQNPMITPSPFPTVCNGNSVSLTASNTSVSYHWSTGSTASTIVVTPTDNTYYTLTTTGGIHGCSSSDSIEVNFVKANLDVYNTTCGNNDGAIYTNPTGGDGSYNYSWSIGGTPTYETGLAPGNYTVTITDGNGCSVTQSATIIDPGPLTLPPLTKTDITCNGANNGTATANPTGGTPPYYYTWTSANQSQYTQTATGLAPGGYTVTVTDYSSCSASVTDFVTITQPSYLGNNLLSSTNVSCRGGSNGTASTSIFGGTTPYTFLWSPSGQTTQNASNLSAGTFTSTVTDQNGCMAETTVTINQPAAALAVAVSQTNLICNAQCNGSATAAPAGGTTPYTYLWNNGQTTPAATGLCANTFTISLSDSKGCAASQTVALTQPAVITVTATPTNVSCNGMCDGSVISTVSGGTTPYSYTWSPGGNTTSFVSGLCAANYSLAIQDANGCAASQTATITQPAILTATITKTDASCNASCNGTATATPAGGTAPYTYAWLPSGNMMQTATGLCAGTHTVTVLDSHNCLFSDTISIVQPLAVPVTATATPTSCGSLSGTAVVSVSGPGAVPPFSYLWTTGSTSTAISALDAGIYRANVTDANGCFGFADALVTSSNGPSITTNSVTDVSCFGSSNGAIDISVTGGSQPYTLSWSNGQTTEDASGLSYGPYEVKVTDASGCLVMKSISVNQPAKIILSSSVTGSACAATTGSASVLVNGGTSPYTYLWAAGGTTSAKSAIGAGVYEITVTDSKGCMDSTLIAVQDIGGPVVFVDTIVAANCGNSGYVLLVPQNSLDISSYNWTTGATTQNLNNVTTGNYGVVITDISGCKTALITPVNPVLPPIKPICLVTVDTLAAQNIVVWEKPISTFIAGFNIYRESSQQGVYQKIAYSPYANESTYYDSIADPDIKWARYRISMVDICGAEGPLSPDHKTIHLSIQSSNIDSTVLIWDTYVGFPFSEYHIFRKDGAAGIWQVIDSVNANLTTYIDTTFPQNGDTMFYHVDISHSGGDCNASLKNPTLFATTIKGSKSNSSERVTNNPTLISETISDSWLKVYPNPNQGTFTVQNSKYKIQSLKIYNMLGEMEYQINVNAPKAEITIPKIVNGIYQMSVVTESGTTTRKIVISK